MKRIQSKGELIFSFFLLALIGWFIIDAFSYRLQVRITPLVIGIPAAVLAAAKIILDLSRPKKPSYELDGYLRSVKIRNVRMRQEHVTFILLIGFVALIFLFGFLIAIPLFLFFQLKFLNSERWPTAIGISVGTCIFSYVLFVLIFEIPLFGGVFDIRNLF